MYSPQTLVVLITFEGSIHLYLM